MAEYGVVVQSGSRIVGWGEASSWGKRGCNRARGGKGGRSHKWDVQERLWERPQGEIVDTGNQDGSALQMVHQARVEGRVASSGTTSQGEVQGGEMKREWCRTGEDLRGPGGTKDHQGQGRCVEASRKTRQAQVGGWAWPEHGRRTESVGAGGSSAGNPGKREGSPEKTAIEWCALAT